MDCTDQTQFFQALKGPALLVDQAIVAVNAANTSEQPQLLDSLVHKLLKL